MATQFNLNGVTYTRLSYVQKEINEVIRYQLRSDQQFNVEVFSSSTGFWAPGLQPVTAANIDSAVAYSSALQAGGGTATGAALTAAFAQKSVEAIYLLSDGVPDDPAGAYLIAQQLEAQNPIPIYCTALAADAGGKQFLSKVATLTKGVYREINGN